ncbi:hypothetical protein V3C99_008611 [Haemonchus contortus]
MFFYIVCALILLNAFTTEAEPCVDKAAETKAGERFCEYMQTPQAADNEPPCITPNYHAIAKEYCAKSCGLCE